MRRFRTLTDREWASVGIPSLLQIWGYPRCLAYEEIRTSHWFEYGEDCVFWLEPVIGDPASAVFHVVVSPETQKKHGGKVAFDLIRGVYLRAMTRGFTRLISNDCTESGEVTDYLKRLGWTPCVMETIEGEWYEKRFTDGDGEPDGQTPETQDRPTV